MKAPVGAPERGNEPAVYPPRSQAAASPAAMRATVAATAMSRTARSIGSLGIDGETTRHLVKGQPQIFLMFACGQRGTRREIAFAPIPVARLGPRAANYYSTSERPPRRRSFCLSRHGGRRQPQDDLAVILARAASRGPRPPRRLRSTRDCLKLCPAPGCPFNLKSVAAATSRRIALLDRPHCRPSHPCKCLNFSFQSDRTLR